MISTLGLRSIAAPLGVAAASGTPRISVTLVASNPLLARRFVVGRATAASSSIWRRGFALSRRLAAEAEASVEKKAAKKPAAKKTTKATATLTVTTKKSPAKKTPAKKAKTAATDKAAKAKAKKTAAAAAAKKKKAAAATKKKAAAAAAKKKKKATPRRKASEKVEARRKRSVEYQKHVALLRTALLSDQPHLQPTSSFLVFYAREMKLRDWAEGASAKERMQKVIAKFNALPQSELASLAEEATRNRAINKVTFKQWVETHTPEEINNANNARRRLNRIPGRKRQITLIKDERQPRRPILALPQYIKARYAAVKEQNPDQPAVDVLRSIAKEYAGLSAAQRQPYVDAAKKDMDRYEQEVKQILHRDIRKSPPAEA